MKRKPLERPRLVYGEAGPGLVFVDPDLAADLAGFWKAVYSKTWGELKKKVSPARYEHVVERYMNTHDDDEEPGPDDAFDGSEMIGDGDYPEWLAQEMLDWVPEPIQEAYGVEQSSTLNGNFLTLDPNEETAIVAALRAVGYEVSRDDKLVNKACGM